MRPELAGGHDGQLHIAAVAEQVLVVRDQDGTGRVGPRGELPIIRVWNVAESIAWSRGVAAVHGIRRSPSLTARTIFAERPLPGALGIPPDVPVVTRDEVAHTKQDPDLFVAAAERLSVPVSGSHRRRRR